MTDTTQNTVIHSVSMKSPEVPKEMKVHLLRQQLFSPTDHMVSPCTQKLMGMKGRGKQRLLHQAFKGAAVGKGSRLQLENEKENVPPSTTQ